MFYFHFFSPTELNITFFGKDILYIYFLIYGMNMWKSMWVATNLFPQL